jgi:hypothetical protein
MNIFLILQFPNYYLVQKIFNLNYKRVKQCFLNQVNFKILLILNNKVEIKANNLKSLASIKIMNKINLKIKYNNLC